MPKINLITALSHIKTNGGWYSDESKHQVKLIIQSFANMSTHNLELTLFYINNYLGYEVEYCHVCVKAVKYRNAKHIAIDHADSIEKYNKLGNKPRAHDKMKRGKLI